MNAQLGAEVLIRWDRADVPAAASLGLTTLVVPEKNAATVRSALAQGYRIYLEVDASAMAGFVPPSRDVVGVVVKGVKGKPTALALKQLQERLKPRGIRVVALEERGKWPHIRSNWVTKNNEVLQVTGRSAQPWIENNKALLRVVHDSRPDPPVLGYTWTPITLADADEGPRLENYLVAIAEAGSFGGDLVLPLHDRFQSRLLLGQPQARAEWAEIRRYLEFYSWNLTQRYQPIANIGVVTAEPMLWYEVMNLLARHNLPFEVIAPADLAKRELDRFKLLIALDKPAPALDAALAAFEKKGGKVAKPAAIADPSAFALEMRRLVNREDRVLEIWNGITVLMAPYQEPEGQGVLITALNYAHQELPMQVRVRGIFSSVEYERPEAPAGLIPHRHRDGYTEFVLPDLRIGARVFLSR